LLEIEFVVSSGRGMGIFGFPHPDPSQIGGYMVMVISYGLEKINNRHITLNPKPLLYSLVAFVTNEGAV
jgi:hypothetical protein